MNYNNLTWNSARSSLFSKGEGGQVKGLNGFNIASRTGEHIQLCY